MLRKSDAKLTNGISDDRRRKSTTVNNLNVSPFSSGKFHKSATRKQKSRYSRSSSNVEENGPASRKVSGDAARLASNVPKDAAVHFGSFYGAQGTNKPQAGKIRSSSRFPAMFSRVTPRLEFTRQMVHKLEKAAGTEEYARQVSVLLEETVEPPCFKPYSLPAENSIPDGKHNPSGYPLWYKEPFKTQFTSEENYDLLNNYDDILESGKYIFNEESLEDDSCKELTDDEEIEKDESALVLDANDTMKKEESLNASASRSSSSTEAKDTDSKETILTV